MADSAFHAIRRGGYTNVDNDVFRHGLSARAIGLLVLMLSKPPEWRFASERIATEVKEGREAVRAALRELDEVGFVKRRTIGGTTPPITQVFVRDSLDVPWPWDKPQVAPSAQKPVAQECGAGKLGPLVTTEKVTTQTNAQPSLERRQMERNFEEFWKLYPRRVGKKKARAAFEKIDFSLPANWPAVIATALNARCCWWTACGTPMVKIPHPTTWLNEERWNDEIEPVMRQVAPKVTTQERFEQAAEMVENMNGESIFDRMRRAGAPEQKAISG